jgi:hypothetical protein
MSSRPVTLDVPDELYDRARQIAAAGEQRIEDVMVSELSAALHTPEPALSPDEEAELAALRHLSDDALWTIARERLPADVESRLQALLEEDNSLNPDQRAELDSLVERGDRLMVRRAEAAAILTRRGFFVTSDHLNK